MQACRTNSGCCMVSQGRPYLGLNTWQVSQELGGHSVQGVSGPLAEPVNGGAVDQAGELAQALPELPSHWAEAQHHVQVTLHLQGTGASVWNDRACHQQCPAHKDQLVFAFLCTLACQLHWHVCLPAVQHYAINHYWRQRQVVCAYCLLSRNVLKTLAESIVKPQT